MASTPRPVQSVDNTELYNRWAKLYDTDGNFLQAVDDLLLPDLLQTAFTLLPQSPVSVTITELGCGTGRNTVKLLTNSSIAHINGLDLSSGMLEVAQKKCADLQQTLPSSQPQPTTRFLEFDALNAAKFPEVAELEGKADLVLSTLVLEHLPVDVFFATIKRLLKPNGVVVFTNMHSEMGNISQAGFVDEATGEKVRGLSFAHTVEEVVQAAAKEGLELVGKMVERGVSDEEAESGSFGIRGKKWAGVQVWYGGLLRPIK